MDLHNEKSIHDDPLDEIRNDREVTESRIFFDYMITSLQLMMLLFGKVDLNDKILS
mgnify:CR=1 FL=1